MKDTQILYSYLNRFKMGLGSFAQCKFANTSSANASSPNELWTRLTPTPEPYWLKGGLVVKDEGETCPARLGRGNILWGLENLHWAKDHSKLHPFEFKGVKALWPTGTFDPFCLVLLSLSLQLPWLFLHLGLLNHLPFLFLQNFLFFNFSFNIFSLLLHII